MENFTLNETIEFVQFVAKFVGFVGIDENCGKFYRYKIVFCIINVQMGKKPISDYFMVDGTSKEYKRE